MWLSSLLLLLGTVGVLITARIALAVLLGVGPIFITMALFGPTRGLFAGWLRGVLLTAITPMLAVLGGALMVELAVPVVATLRNADGIDGRAAMALFVIASVHCAVMALAIRVASTMVSGWRVFGGGQDSSDQSQTSPAQTMSGGGFQTSAQPFASTEPRLLAMVSGMSAAGAASNAGSSGAAPATTHVLRTMERPANAGMTVVRPNRARGIGSRFSSPAKAQGNLRNESLSDSPGCNRVVHGGNLVPCG